MLPGVAYLRAGWACVGMTGLLVLLLCLTDCSAEQPGDRAITRNPAAGGKGKVALVVGNKDYRQAPLQNPVNDAQVISRTLTRLGFSVTAKTNVNQEDFEHAINRFARESANADVALFYFSGHGCQSKGENYLVPVGQDFQSEADLRYRAVNAGVVLAKMEEAGSRVNLMILDACRNNPFKGFRDQTRGLTVQEAPPGSFIAYATAPGKVASDSPHESNSVYTKHLVRALETQGLDIDQAFRMVAKGVHKDTDRQQVPWISSSLVTDFSFSPRPIAAVAPTVPPKPAAPFSTPVRQRDPSKDKLFLDAANKSEWIRARQLLDEGADVNTKDGRGLTALMRAALNPKVDVVKYLISAGADVNAESSGGLTALLIAASWGSVDVMQLLISKGADVNAKPKSGNTALIKAAERGKVEAMQLLVSKGADVNAKNKAGHTALIKASEFGMVEAMQFLISKGADVNAKNNFGKTPLTSARGAQTADLLRKHGAK